MHFFWIKKICWKGVLTDVLVWTSPLICPKKSLIKKSDLYDKKQVNLPRLKRHSKRNVSLLPSAEGSITVETAIVLPLFLFFCIQIISMINLFQIHSTVQAALHQETARLAMQAYAFDRPGADAESSAVHFAEDVYLRSKVIDRAGKAYLDRSMIKGGSGGIHVLYTGTENGQETVDTVLSYRVEPIVKILGFSGFSMKNSCHMKAWTGYVLSENAADGEGNDELVYVTETGSVYHKNRNCTYLALSIRSVKRESVSGLRNETGAKYYPCEKCGADAGSTVFLTEQGNRYHSSLACNGLKRTIYTVPISEAGGRGPCSRCSDTG